jgi:hypothetical protein
MRAAGFNRRRSCEVGKRSAMQLPAMFGGIS